MAAISSMWSEMSLPALEATVPSNLNDWIRTGSWTDCYKRKQDKLVAILFEKCLVRFSGMKNCSN